MENVKKLGFGAMRLPKLEDGSFNMPMIKDMVDLFLKRGFTYFDTAYVYDSGGSERALNEALVSRYPRDSYTIATKLPSWHLKSLESRDEVFQESMDRLGVDYVDYYLLHNVNKETIGNFDKYDCWTWLEEQKANGKAKHVGFSFHDTADMLDEVLTKHPFVDFVQLQINYIDMDSPKVQSAKVLEVARSHGKPVVVMEPIKGGMLATPPQDAIDAFAAVNPDASPASFAVRYVASQEGVFMVLSGMSSLEQMEDNSSFMENFHPLNEEENAAVAKAVEALNAVPTVPCTSCQYCMEGCPMSIPIPRYINLLNNIRRYGFTANTPRSYNMSKDNGGDAWDCIGCGQCESVCPQHLEIPKYLEELSSHFKS